MTVSGKRILPVVLGVVITSAIVGSALPASKAYAGQITTRTLTLEGVGGNGGSDPNVNADDHFTFTIPNAADDTIKSMMFTYCTGAREAVCTPFGGDASSAGLTLNTGLTGWTMGTKTANTVVISNSTGVDLKAVTADLTLTTVKNPPTADTSFYVDIQTFTSSDGSGTAIDDGWVAASTSNPIVLTGTMPESLVFCTGGTIDDTSGPTCTNPGSPSITFNQLFSPTDTATATSQMAASTNAIGGYVITVSGNTLQNGGSSITAMGDGSHNAVASTTGLSQFGMNLTTNATPAVGADITPASSSSTLRGEPSTHYATADSFLFDPTDEAAVADSASGGAGGTDLQIYTVSYIVNVDGAQTAGTYTTTLTYTCTSTF